MIHKICPECESDRLTVSEQGALVCEECGFALHEAVQLCARCNQLNEPTAEVCSNCAEPLSVVDRVLGRQTIAGKPRWLQDARDQAQLIKEHESASSQQRMDRFIEEDRLREQELREAQERQEQQERRTLSATVAFTAVALVLIVIITLVIALRG